MKNLFRSIAIGLAIASLLQLNNSCGVEEDLDSKNIKQSINSDIHKKANLMMRSEGGP